MRGILFLVGFMGSGKRTVGAGLAGILGLPFVDLDGVVEAAEDMSIAEIFQLKGEAHFRVVESSHLARVVSQAPSVVAVGGGAFSLPANRRLMRENGITVWLDVALDVAWGRCGQDSTRPLASDYSHFERLFHERRPSFGLADMRVEVGGRKPETIAREISRRLRVEFPKSQGGELDNGLDQGDRRE